MIARVRLNTGDHATMYRRNGDGHEQIESTAVDFLERLRPGGPWVLTAIEPDGPIRTITASTAAEVDAFVHRHDGKRNLYYSTNPTRSSVTTKAAKTDIAAIEYALADLDPDKDETAEDAKARYLAQLDGFEPKPTAAVDSGNGLQCLWRLENRIALGKPVAVDADGKKELKFSREDQAKIDGVENRTKALMLRFGAKAGTQNIDRILRLPGTANLPTKAKRKAGRVACRAELLWFEDTTHPLEAFPPEAEAQKGGDRRKTKGHTAPGDGEEDELARTIRDGGEQRHGPTRSDGVWWVTNEMLRRGYAAEAIEKTLLDPDTGISEHIYDQPDPKGYAARQVAKAKQKIDFATDNKGVPYKGRENINVALLKFGVTVRHDRFADRVLIAGLDGFGPALDDAAVVRLWLDADRRFRLAPSKEMMFTVVMDTARLNGFHPVRDYLDGLVWDGVERIDRWLTDYGQARDDDYTSAVGALMLTAAVRRVRRPGCKFDEMVVLNGEQGTLKSTALAVLAVRDEWFCDDLPLNLEGKRVIEALRGKWLVEAAELSGMRRTDIEHIKALLSRQFDRGRMSYDRIVSEIPRQNILIGTTNASEYLKDLTGNRRFWPVRCKRFDIKALKRDRDQLWAEAAAREASGCSIRLHSSLWPKAMAEQKKRLTADPYLAALQHEIGDLQGKISSRSLWEILEMKAGNIGQEQSRRIGDAMRALGWRRPNTAGTVKIDGKAVVGWVRGEQPWPEITVDRGQDGKLCVDQVEGEA